MARPSPRLAPVTTATFGEIDCAHTLAARAASVGSDLGLEPHRLAEIRALRFAQQHLAAHLSSHPKRDVRRLRIECNVNEMHGLERQAALQLAPARPASTEAPPASSLRSASTLDRGTPYSEAWNRSETNWNTLPRSRALPRTPCRETRRFSVFRQLDLAHQRMHVLARIHAGDGRIVDIGHRSTQLVEIRANPCRTTDRFAMTGNQ